MNKFFMYVLDKINWDDLKCSKKTTHQDGTVRSKVLDERTR